ncbi:hypothetical protein MA16_Dca008164 [Dendrobium catenatum]|uniref:Uncharacterized protein n=1 Tax=Dendrobium catenatum TaxID=906689 RepID=A0A2I0XA32_9ASPA|nr:hypothetical protein MA16_Dca008164 [Dendrobium catenatum]
MTSNIVIGFANRSSRQISALRPDTKKLTKEVYANSSKAVWRVHADYCEDLQTERRCNELAQVVENLGKEVLPFEFRPLAPSLYWSFQRLQFLNTQVLTSIKSGNLIFMVHISGPPTGWRPRIADLLAAGSSKMSCLSERSELIFHFFSLNVASLPTALCPFASS